jgi:hypothetical protein
MLSAMILVCSLASVPNLASCTEANATQVIRDPETFASPVTCYVHGQAYVAQTELGRDLGDSDFVKVVCARSRAAAGSSPEAETSATLAR